MFYEHGFDFSYHSRSRKINFGIRGNKIEIGIYGEPE